MRRKRPTQRELARLTGKRRRETLIQGAKEEGKLTFYTSTAPEDIQSLLLAFDMRYPFIRAEMVRDKGVVIRERIAQEYRAGGSPADVIELTDLNLGKLKERGLLQPYRSPEADSYPRELCESEGYWVAEQKNFLVLAWNTRLVEEAVVPHCYDGLLDPRLKGKITIEAHDAAWMAALMDQWGEKKAVEFFSSFGFQVGSARAGHQIIAEQIAAGSVLISPHIHSNNSEWLKRRGLPIDWRPLEPVVVELVGAALPIEPPHPHAALLLIDFILSFEGQKIYSRWKRVPCHPGVEVDPPYMSHGFDSTLVDAKAFLRRESEHEKLWNDLILKPVGN
ncbi:MAG: ABC transporter substrate-binding protein [Deltaproteobacteria bacterium]|nr:ABC transporter substrate-binding protein [Deltaproteobacteria bacterium]